MVGRPRGLAELLAVTFFGTAIAFAFFSFGAFGDLAETLVAAPLLTAFFGLAAFFAAGDLAAFLAAGLAAANFGFLAGLLLAGESVRFLFWG